MRLRRADWDVPMPSALVAYWTAWNATDLDEIGPLLERAVTDDVLWHDPRDAFVGRAALHDAIVALRTAKPQYRFVIASEIDHHHGRHRYRWDMLRGDRVLMEGLDIATIDPVTDRIERVDGFFGQPTPVLPAGSVPDHLRAGRG